jgi:DNA-binding HxlR family transcriptional regulator
MSRMPENPLECGVTATIGVIGGRWKPIILWVLSGGKRRFGQLNALIPRISRKILTEQLKELEEDGLINRLSFAEIPPRVEYSLTERGETLKPLLKQMCSWGLENVLEDKIKR